MKEKEFRATVLLECLGEPIRFQILRNLQTGRIQQYVLASVTALIVLFVVAVFLKVML